MSGIIMRLARLILRQAQDERMVVGFFLSIFLNISAQHGQVPLYFCTAADKNYFEHVLNLIGSLHWTHYPDIKKIAVFDLGLTQDQRNYLQTIDKLELWDIKKVNPDIITFFKTGWGDRVVPGWYAWKPVAIWQVLQKYPYVLWLDAGTTVKKQITHVFKYIQQTGYFLATIGDEDNGKITHTVNWGMTKFVREKFNIADKKNNWILEKEQVMGGIIGARADDKDKFIRDLYLLAHDLQNYADDGTAPHGFGTARHDQTLMSILAYGRKIPVHVQDFKQQVPIYLCIDGNKLPFYITWHADYVDSKTDIYSSRNDLRHAGYYRSFIRFKKS